MTTNENIEIDKNLLWQVSVELPQNTSFAKAEAYEELFADIANSTLIEMNDNESPQKLKIIFLQKTPPKMDKIKEILNSFTELNIDEQNICIKELEDRNWLQHVYKEFPPITLKDFFIFGEHYTGKIPNNLIPLQISTAMAFGSGEHQTTQGCLLALLELKKLNHNFEYILDMGCGSGILSVAAAKLWPNARIIAIDIEENSILATKNHAKVNNCLNIETYLGDGYNAHIIKNNNISFDLIISNIFANILIEFAEDLSKNLKNDGYAILAGLLKEQENKVKAKHQEFSVMHCNKTQIDGWAILSMKKELKPHYPI